MPDLPAPEPASPDVARFRLFDTLSVFLASASEPREREVAGPLAEGLSNRQIAERLYVSERTAETHVQHILAKLEVHLPPQVAGWAVREGLHVQP